MMHIPNHPNDPAYDPPPRCGWDGCDDENIVDDPMFGEELCYTHLGNAYEEFHGELAYDMAKEDSIK